MQRLKAAMQIITSSDTDWPKQSFVSDEEQEFALIVYFVESVRLNELIAAYCVWYIAWYDYVNEYLTRVRTNTAINAIFWLWIKFFVSHKTSFYDMKKVIFFSKT